MKLNRTGSNWDELERSKINENWRIIEGGYNDVVGQITDEVVGHLIDSAKLNWKEPVETVADLPKDAEVGETRMVRETDDGVSHVYRYNGEKWELIQEIDATLVNEIDRRLSAQMSENMNKIGEDIEFSISTVSARKKGKRPIVSFISDDSPISDWNILKPIIEEKNVPIGLGVITSKISTEGFLSWEQLKEMEDVGCEILSHTHEHRDSRTLPLDVLEEDIKLSKQILNDNGFYPKGFVYPYNSHDLNTVSVVQKYFNYSFSKSAGPAMTTTGKNYPKINNQIIARVSLGSYFDVPMEGFPQDTSSLEYYKSRVDEALENNNWLVFVLHTWHEDFDATQQQYFKNIIDYVRTKDIDIVSPQEGFDIYGNLIQIGIGRKRFWVDADGDEDSSNNKVVITNPNEKGFNSHIVNDFEAYKVTYTPITRAFAQSEGFPEGKSGILVTYNLEAGYTFRYQEWIVTDNKPATIYQRFVNPDLSWGGFVSDKNESFNRPTSERFTVPAQSTYDLELTGIAELKFQDSVMAVPFGYINIPEGIMFHPYKTNNGSLVLRFSNVTSEEIDIPEIEWAITVNHR